MQLTRNKMIAAGVILVLLVVTFTMGGGYARGEGKDDDGLQVAAEELSALGEKTDLDEEEGLSRKDAEDRDEKAADEDENEADAKEAEDADDEAAGEDAKATDEPEPTLEINPATGMDKYQTEPVPDGKPLPVEPQSTEIGSTALTCTLLVECSTILDNISYLNQEKVELVPEDGVIFAKKTVTFYEGESVFNVLQREMKGAKIHMEFVNTPIYNSAYIEGINNLYEFDCGELSGWMYKVNGWFPNYGCSRYLLQQGDEIVWAYTCDLGKDVGGEYAAGGQ